MDFRRQDGAISVYLSIIFLVIIALAGMIVDGARVRIGETQVKRACETAVMSSLAGYSKLLKEDYGLFALAQNDPDQLNTMIEEYLNGNLMTGLGGDKEELARTFLGNILESAIRGEKKDIKFANLFDYRLDGLEATPCYNLTENEVMRNQICEFMKFRAPKQLAVQAAKQAGLFSLAKELKKAGNSSKALEKKMQLEDLLGKLGNRQIELADYVNTVKLFPESSSGEYSGKGRTEGMLLGNYKRMDGEYLKEAEAYLKKSGENGLKAGKTNVNNKYLQIEASLKACRLKNGNCLQAAESIIRLKKDIENRLSEFDSFIKAEKANLDADFINSMEEELELARESIKKDNSEIVKEKASKNLSIINSVIPVLRELNSVIDTFDTSEFTTRWNKDSLPLGLKTGGLYDNRFTYSYLSLNEWKAKKGKNTTAKTNRQDTRNQASAAGKDIEKGEQVKDYIKEIDEDYYNSRPSLMKDGKYPNKIISQGAGGKVKNTDTGRTDEGLQKLSGKPPELGKSNAFAEDDISNVKAALGSMIEIGDVLNDFLLTGRDELFVNEYVMGMFTNDVPIIKKNIGGTLKVFEDTSGDLRLKEKGTERKAYLKHGEVEYVIFGLRGEEDNIRSVSLAIGGIRFGINLAALHKMPRKMEEATIIAEAIAASIAAATAGTGAAASAASINAIREVVLAGWASLEAYQDVKYLKQGRLIPVWKDERTWITDEDGGTKAVDRGDSGSVLQTSYHDYLRLFLAVKTIASKDGKINNIEDIVQYNVRAAGSSGFKLADCNTYINLEASVTMRYLFMSYAFMPKRLKTEDGRHKFRTVVFQGY